jgi:hypothetical protein
VTTAARILTDRFARRSPRGVYWAATRLGEQVARLARRENHGFARHVARDFARFCFGRSRSIPGETETRARAAADWLLRAHREGGDGGVSYGYFPCDVPRGWRSSYPETTGYIIPSLLEFARITGDDSARQAALAMASWEAAIQMPSGAVQGGPVCPPDRQTPSAFNTGAVLDGWSAAFAATRAEGFLRAGRRAADWLVGDLTDQGYFRTHGKFVEHAEIKTYDCLCGWPLVRFGREVGDGRYESAGIRTVEAAVAQQRPNGWFANNDLDRPEAPLLHTIGYTLQGILEVGLLVGREDLVSAVERGVEPLVARVERRAFLHGRFYSDWQPATFSACLTGSAQLAVVLYRLGEHTGLARHLAAADRILNHLKALQAVESPDAAVVGALGGSFPLFGEYMTAGYPNWATKYLLDGLLLQGRLRARSGVAPSERRS